MNKPTKSRLFTVYNRARGVAHQGVIDRGRVDRALGILQTKEREEKYYTTISGCDCPDSQYHPNTICKHRLALMMSKRINQMRGVL